MSEEEKLARQDNEKGGSKKALVIVSAVSVAVIAVLAAALYVSSRKTQEVVVSASQETRAVVVHRDNAESIAEQMFSESKSNVPMSYQVTMNSTWVFPDGQSASTNAYVENSDDNKTPVYFDVIRKDTQETIYRSPVIPLGDHLDNIQLDVDLDAGDYECTLVYHLIDDDQNTLTTVNMWLMIRIEN